jgi:hypothetical protein
LADLSTKSSGGDTVKRLFEYYDGLREPRRMITAVGVLFALLMFGLWVRVIGYVAVGWLITILPILFLITARALYLRGRT